LVHSDHRYGERRRQDEVSLLVGIQADLDYHLDLVIGEVVPGFSAHSQQRVLKASSVSSSEQLFGVRCAAVPAQSLRQRQTEIKKPIVTPD